MSAWNSATVWVETHPDFIATFYDHCAKCGPNRTCPHFGLDRAHIAPRDGTTCYVYNFPTTRATTTLHVVRQDNLQPVPTVLPMPPFPERLRGRPGRRAAAAPKHLLMLNARSRR